jgi:hypothetical protein
MTQEIFHKINEVFKFHSEYFGEVLLFTSSGYEFL